MKNSSLEMQVISMPEPPQSNNNNNIGGREIHCKKHTYSNLEIFLLNAKLGRFMSCSPTSTSLLYSCEVNNEKVRPCPHYGVNLGFKSLGPSSWGVFSFSGLGHLLQLGTF